MAARQLRAIALLVTVLAAAFGISTAAVEAAGSGPVPASPARVAPVCSLRPFVRSSPARACTTSVVASVGVIRSVVERRVSAGTWGGAARSVVFGATAAVEAPPAPSCPHQVATDNPSRAPPSP